jgi:hypothetical protein
MVYIESCLNSFIKLSSHVGTVAIRGFSPEEKAVAEELGGQPREASQTLTFLLSKANPGACRSYLPVESFIICACKCIMHLRIGFE